MDVIFLIGLKREVVAFSATEFQDINHDKNASAKYLLIPFISTRSIKPQRLQPAITNSGGPPVHAHSYYQTADAGGCRFGRPSIRPFVRPSVCPVGLRLAQAGPQTGRG